MLPSALNAVGWCHAHLGNYQQAIISCEQAIGMSRELGDRFVEGAALDTLGYIYHHLRRYPEAINCYENSFGLQRERGDHYNQAVVIRHLGDTHYAAGDLIAARGAWQQALNVLNDLRHPEAGQVRAQLSRDPG
jgi:tetratricopeptide (TPR) repeat protein